VFFALLKEDKISKKSAISLHSIIDNLVWVMDTDFVTNADFLTPFFHAF